MIWPDVSEAPIQRVNTFLAQFTQDPEGAPEDFILTAGHIAPPVLLGSAEEQKAAFAAMGAVSVHTLARISMSPARLFELIDLLQNTANKLKQARGEGDS